MSSYLGAASTSTPAYVAVPKTEAEITAALTGLLNEKINRMQALRANRPFTAAELEQIKKDFMAKDAPNFIKQWKLGGSAEEERIRRGVETGTISLAEANRLYAAAGFTGSGTQPKAPTSMSKLALAGAAAAAAFFLLK